MQASNSFPSAHVFPGGHISPFHEPDFPPPNISSAADPQFHRDSLAYRLAAVRETFEESGILLARAREAKGHDDDNNNDASPLLTIPPDIAATFRTAVHGETVKFTDFLDKQGARPCTDGLVPFTRWITPAWSKGRRFTTQMYLFCMPLTVTTPVTSPSKTSSSPSPGVSPSSLSDDVLGKGHTNIITPTSDGGIEHTAATFATPAEWLRQQAEGRIILFPPQCFLLTLVARVFDAVEAASSSSLPSSSSSSSPRELYAAQRKALLEFIHKPTATPPEGSDLVGMRSSVVEGKTTDKIHPTAMIPWTDKVMSPEPLFTQESDGRLVLGVDKPGSELKSSGRGGDFERVVLVHFKKEGPRNVEVQQRADVLGEEKERDQTKIAPSKI